MSNKGDTYYVFGEGIHLDDAGFILEACQIRCKRDKSFSFLLRSYRDPFDDSPPQIGVSFFSGFSTVHFCPKFSMRATVGGGNIEEKPDSMFDAVLRFVDEMP